MMNLWTDPRRVRRALFVLVLMLGQFAATAAAARPGCVFAHDAAAPRTQVEATVAAAASPQGTAAVERSATAAPHDHAPGKPSVPGASSCTTLVLAVLSAEEDPSPVEAVIPIAAAEGSLPTSASAPPPYRPPRA